MVRCKHVLNRCKETELNKEATLFEVEDQFSRFTDLFALGKSNNSQKAKFSQTAIRSQLNDQSYLVCMDEWLLKASGPIPGQSS